MMSDAAIERLRRDLAEADRGLANMPGRVLASEMRMLLCPPPGALRAAAVLLEAIARIEGRRRGADMMQAQLGDPVTEALTPRQLSDEIWDRR